MQVIHVTAENAGSIRSEAMEALSALGRCPIRENYMGNEARLASGAEPLTRVQLAAALEDCALWLDARGVPIEPPAAVVYEVYEWLQIWGCVQ